jgi:hypothetical protein
MLRACRSNGLGTHAPTSEEDRVHQAMTYEQHCTKRTGAEHMTVFSVNIMLRTAGEVK